MKRRINYLFLIMACVMTLSACAGPLRYSADPIEAKIIDVETKQPLEGVIVVAHWELERGTEGGNIPVGQLKVMEAVTDKHGKFVFPGFGPETIWIGFLVDKDPELIIFKPDYEYRRLLNPYTSDRELRTRKVRQSDWSGKTIALKPFKGTDEEYAQHVYNLDGNLEFARYGSMGTLDDCEWKKIPRMLVALHRMREYFDSKGVKLPGWRGGARIRKITDVGNQGQCGSAEKFFRGYLP